MRAINNNVFIERLPMETTHMGMDISEKALTKNFRGIIKAVESDKNVVFGQTVHIPHYGVKDMEIDGTEYAVTKVGELFAVLEGDTYKPINRFVKVRKCVNDHIRDSSGEVSFYMTENHIEKTNCVEILDVADDCETMCGRYIGYYTFAPENDEKLARLGYSKDFMLHEDLIKFVTDGE